MNPTEPRDLLSLYIDGELDEAQARVLERRLATDDALREDYERIRRTSSSLRSYFDATATASTCTDDYVQRIARESAAALQRPKSRRLPSLFAVLVALALLTALASGLLLFFNGGPSAKDLARRANAVISERYLELHPRLGGIGGLLGRKFPELMRWPDVMGWETPKLQTGPGGRFHVSATVPDTTGETRALHGGFDGEKYWSFIEGDPAVRILESPEQLNDSPVEIWARLCELIDRHADGGDGVRLLGRVGGDEAGTEDWWKLEMRGERLGDRLGLWFDGDQRLRRIAFLGLEIDVVERPGLGPEVFAIDTWAPGVPLRKEAR